ncbi:unnamed protein product [Cylicocyclus nassatus]|uniref:Uncharacterized protein n=1 Tax=Cylicocyclus nassatus TaxID=53992 RepID=A0AA36HDZ0_CYLNA|nr:unnamed protein product [Cylicocyclus nassatus]
MLYLKAIFILLLLLCTPRASYECQPSERVQDCLRECLRKNDTSFLCKYSCYTNGKFFIYY